MKDFLFFGCFKMCRNNLACRECTKYEAVWEKKKLSVCCRKGKYYKWEAKRRRGTLTFLKKCEQMLKQCDMKTYHENVYENVSQVVDEKEHIIKKVF